MDREKCTVYIDESGDLGVGRGTRWFVITGVIVKEKDEKDLRNTILKIKRKLNLREIHLKNIHDFYKTSYIISQLKPHPFTIVNILMDTSKCELTNTITTYNYMCRFLLERASWYMDDNNLEGEIVLSSRGTSRDSELISYINDKLLHYSRNQIRNVFTGVKCKQASSWDMLQLADICATSMFRSHEINSLGFVTPCYMSNLIDKLYRRKGNLDSYGRKYFLDSMKPDNEYYMGHSLCNI